MDEVKYDGIFSFKFSPRPNTPALTMPDSIPEDEKSRRLAVLQARQRDIQSAANEKLLGQTFEVMTEGKSRRENQWSGHTSCHRVLNFSSPQPDLLGKYVQVKVTSAGPNSLAGEHVA
jgi:tRNA-2-methylthio-N6-dimethylallyladenosine synthase